MDFKDLCRKMISIESTPSTGNAEVALFCASLCKDFGLEVTLQEGTLRELRQLNVLARPKKKKAKTEEVVFQSHLDTVEPGPLGNWTKTDSNPFNATLEGDRIYGLGTADVKLDFLCKLFALKELRNEGFKRPFVLVGTYGEEIGMQGARQLIESGEVTATMALIGEPSELQIVHANNGYMVLDFEIPFTKEEKAFLAGSHDNARTQEKIFRGKAVHSSTPHLGDNAITKLVAYLDKLPRGIAVLEAAGGSSVNTVPAEAHIEIDADKNFSDSVGDKLLDLFKELGRLEREFLNFDNKMFSPSHPTLNPGLLKATEKGFLLSVSFRITPDVLLEQLESWVRSLEEFCRARDMVCHRQRLSPPALTPVSSELVRGTLDIAAKLGLPAKPITKASSTECSVYVPNGWECIVFGPGVSVGNSHTANEYNFVSQLEKAKSFYLEAAKRFCL